MCKLQGLLWVTNLSKFVPNTTSLAPRPLPLTPYWAPKYWPTWLLMGCLRLITMLPWQAGQSIGRVLGGLLYQISKHRKNVAQRNIALCFPELTPAQQHQLAKDTFTAHAIGLVETLYTLWGSLKPLEGKVHIEGLDTLEHACAQPQGVLILTAHFSSPDLAGALLSQLLPLVVTYQRNNNPLINTLIINGRARLTNGLIEREQTRQLVKTLKQGATVWVAPDQDLGPKRTIFAPFFGVPTATSTMVSRLAEITQCQVFFYSHHRTAAGYNLCFTPMTKIPSANYLADTTLINQVIEEAVRQHPEQYMWLHRRFKTRPVGAPSIY